MGGILQQDIQQDKTGTHSCREKPGWRKIFTDSRNEVFAQPNTDGKISNCRSSPQLAEFI